MFKGYTAMTHPFYGGRIPIPFSMCALSRQLESPYNANLPLEGPGT